MKTSEQRGDEAAPMRKTFGELV